MEALTTTLRRLAVLLVLLAVPSVVFAHRLDEYLQAMLVAIDPSRGIRPHDTKTYGKGEKGG